MDDEALGTGLEPFGGGTGVYPGEGAGDVVGGTGEMGVGGTDSGGGGDQAQGSAVGKGRYGLASGFACTSHGLPPPLINPSCRLQPLLINPSPRLQPPLIDPRHHLPVPDLYLQQVLPALLDHGDFHEILRHTDLSARERLPEQVHVPLRAERLLILLDGGL